MKGPADPLARLADAIREVGLAAERARRYRALATSVAEPAFERALAIGTAIRRSLRDPERQRADAAEATRELATLLDGCTRAVADVQASAAYRDAVDALAAGATDRVASLAPLLFSGVEPWPDARRVYWPVPIASPRSGSHFLPPAECAARIAACAADGVDAATPPPELGADEHIPAIVLGTEHDVAESPLVLVIEATALPAPLCRLAGGTTAFFYAPGVRVPFRVCTAAIVSDEWWAVRPDAYRAYVDELRSALAPRGIAVETEE